MTDFRALCQELLQGLDENRHPEVRYPGHLRIVMARGRAALAQPEPQGPTDAELITMWATTRYIDQPEGGLAYARAVLARWGRPAIEPVPTSERPWERDGWCDAEGRCYGWDGDYWWMVGNPGWANVTITHWLPYWVLPVPGVEGADA
jgi:hypothetical protein